MANSYLNDKLIVEELNIGDDLEELVCPEYYLKKI